MKKLILLSLLFISCLVYGQEERLITGKVTDEAGATLPGVTIVEKGTTNGTISDINGAFSLKVKSSDVLLSLSFIGYKTQEVSTAGKTTLTVKLFPDMQEMDEVVVVGYGEVRKRDVTGSIAQIKESDEVARQYSSVDALLQGRATGVQVTANAGSPGQGVSVRIRGINSLRGNNEPLYVVDGVIINSAGEDVNKASSDANEVLTVQNGLTGINPRDIESIEILKDASATAIYGSRGANGVVLVTTKQGKSTEEGNAVINAYGTVELAWVSKKKDVLDPITYADYQNESAQLNGFNPKYHVQEGQVFPITYDDEDNATIGDTPYNLIDWQDEIYGMSVTHNENILVHFSVKSWVCLPHNTLNLNQRMILSPVVNGLMFG